MSLTSLPTEIAELITLHLDLPSFSLLRLINSHLNQQSLRSFKDRFFRKRTIQWTEASFRELLDVTDHPTFGDALQNIIIDATPYYGRQIWRMEQILKGNRDEFDDKIEDVSIAKREECWNEANEAAKFWKETELDQKCLTVVFQKLKLVGENRSQESHIESLLFKYERHGSGVFRKYHEICIREMSRPFISIMSAICASGIRIKKILGHEKLRWGAVGIGRLESLAPRLRKFDHAFEHLQVLQLNLRDWRAHEDGFALPEQHIPFIVRFLAKARKLKSLELSCYSVLDKDLFSAMAHTCHYSHLTTCKLDLFSMKDCDLFTFLEPSKSHLKHLTLSQVFLDEKSARHNWPDILRHLVSPSGADLQLECLRVTGLYSRRAAPLLFHALDESQRSTTLTLRSEDGENGKADLKVELEKACRTTIFSFSPIRSFTAAASLAPRLAFDVYE